ncbi:MAG: hydrogenase maturation protease [Actinomycetia bacterium]|nr:hydrogenase maturation protease [Actinomycetes bacterium]MCP4962153.1 hydrogenase maturation protease [Actinomycetes bacterium]
MNEEADAVIGVGAAMRTDDALGLRVVERLVSTGRLGPGVDLVSLDGEPTRLVDVWRDRSLVVIVDAMKAGGEAGSIHRVEVGVDRLPGWMGSHSTHGAGVAEAVALAEVLEVMPARLVVYGVEWADVSFGEELTPSVSAAIDPLIDKLAQEFAS